MLSKCYFLKYSAWYINIKMHNKIIMINMNFNVHYLNESQLIYFLQN